MLISDPWNLASLTSSSLLICLQGSVNMLYFYSGWKLKGVEIDLQPMSVCPPGFLSDLCQTILLSWTLFQSSTYWQLVFPHSVPCCFSIWVCHASTQAACFQSALTFYIYVYLKHVIFSWELLCRHTSERKTSKCDRYWLWFCRLRWIVAIHGKSSQTSGIS